MTGQEAVSKEECRRLSACLAGGVIENDEN